MRPTPGDDCYTELPLQALDATRVEAVWRYTPRHGAGRQLVLPDGRMDLAIHCAMHPDGSVASVWPVLAGQADQPMWAALRAGTVVLGVRFRIGWGGACLGVSPARWRNQTLAGPQVLDVVLAGPGPLGLPASLADDLLRATTLAAALSVLRSVAGAMAERAQPTVAHRRALAAIAQLQGRLHSGAAWHAGPQAGSVADARGYGKGGLAGAGGIGAMDEMGDCERIDGTAPAASRTLRRDIAAAVGLPLRMLAGILRFQAALSHLEAGAPSLTEVALAAGYADQAHMTREFRRFGGFTPALPLAAPLVRLVPTLPTLPTLPPLPPPAHGTPLSETFNTPLAARAQTARH